MTDNKQAAKAYESMMEDEQKADLYENAPTDWQIGFDNGFAEGYEAALQPLDDVTGLKVISSDPNWHIEDAIPWLVDAVDYLLHKHDYDGSKHEEYLWAMRSGERWLTTKNRRQGSLDGGWLEKQVLFVAMLKRECGLMLPDPWRTKMIDRLDTIIHAEIRAVSDGKEEM